MDQAQRQYDYNRAAELQYGRLTQLERELADAEAHLSTQGSTLLKQEVDEQDIAEVVSRWTGVPVSKLMEGEVEKLIKMEERLHLRVIGQDEAGQLSEAVRRRPYSVVLFDEVEKAHPDVFNVLLQILDDGRLTDGQGR